MVQINSVHLLGLHWFRLQEEQEKTSRERCLGGRYFSEEEKGAGGPQLIGNAGISHAFNLPVFVQVIWSVWFSQGIFLYFILYLISRLLKSSSISSRMRPTHPQNWCKSLKASFRMQEKQNRRRAGAWHQNEMQILSSWPSNRKAALQTWLLALCSGCTDYSQTHTD